jgi:hypothetical protein
MDSERNDQRDEALIREFAESLRELKTPEGLRDSNRRYIEHALHSAGAAPSKTPGWFTRRIAVPFPVAAGFLVVFCLQLVLQFFNLADRHKPSEPVLSDTTKSVGPSEESVRPHYSERNVYVAGTGFVENVKQYAYLKEKDNENN